MWPAYKFPSLAGPYARGKRGVPAGALLWDDGTALRWGDATYLLWS